MFYLNCDSIMYVYILVIIMKCILVIHVTVIVTLFF
jgi:hypothetical protein